MSSDNARQEQLEAWRAVAGGWDRHRDAVWISTAAVSERMVELLDLREGEQVLEIAGGAGNTGLIAAPLVGETGRVTITDGVAEMVAAAEREVAARGLSNVSVGVVDAVDLPYEDGTFDAVLCRYGIMLIPDCAGAAAEIARVLRPGGRAAIAVWAESERNPWLTAVTKTALKLGLIERPDPEAPGPFRLAAPGRLRGLLEEAGLRCEAEEEVGAAWRASSLEDWWEIVRQTARSVSELAAKLAPDDLEAVRSGAAERLAPYVQADGSLVVPGVSRVVLAARE